jgi:VanZ family protein
MIFSLPTLKASFMFKNTFFARQPFSPYVLWGFRVIFVFLLILIIWKSIEAPGGKASIPHMDKFLHFGAYATLCFVALNSKFAKEERIVVGAVILIGLSMEALQGMMGLGRSASIWDVVANTLGALSSFWVYRRLQ